MSWTDFNTSWKVENGVKKNEAKGTFNFENGDAQADFVYVDGQLMQFNVESKKLANWFHGPSDATIYQQRGADFLRHLYNREFDQAYALSDPRFQEQVGRDVLEHAASEMDSNGKVEKIEFDDRQWLADARELALNYRLELAQSDGSPKTIYSQVRFDFPVLKGGLIAFKNGADGAMSLSAEQDKLYEPLEQSFVAAVLAEDAAEMIASADPLLRDKLDEAVLAAWLKSVADKHGQPQELASVERETIYDSGNKKVSSRLSFAHEKGEAVWTVSFLNTEVAGPTGIKIGGEIEGWLDHLDAKPYQARAKQFLTTWLNGENETAYNLMDVALREKASPEQLAGIAQQVIEASGPVQSIETGEVEIDSEQLQLRIPCQLTFEKQARSGTVDFAYTGAGLTLIGFNIAPAE